MTLDEVVSKEEGVRAIMMIWNVDRSTLKHDPHQVGIDTAARWCVLFGSGAQAGYLMLSISGYEGKAPLWEFKVVQVFARALILADPYLFFWSMLADAGLHHDWMH